MSTPPTETKMAASHQKKTPTSHVISTFLVTLLTIDGPNKCHVAGQNWTVGLNLELMSVRKLSKESIYLA